jgi:hypothetical protein
VSLASLLAACGGGGGGGGGSADSSGVAWASPAVFVTPGAADKTFGLDCSRTTYTYTYSTNSATQTQESLYTATLKISANGDTVVSAATSTTGTISVLQSIALAAAGNYGWNANGTVQTPTYSLYVNQSGRGESKNFNIYASGERYVLNGLPSEYSYPQGYYVHKYYDCTMTDPLVLQAIPDAARAAKNLGTQAGVTTYDNYYAPGRIEGGSAFWQSDNESQVSNPYDFMRFNLSTGELASSTSTTGTYSAISLSLPSSTTTSGAYGESFERANSFFEYKDAKTICLAKSTYDPVADAGSNLEINATAYGQKLLPSSYFYNYINGGGDDKTSSKLAERGMRGGCGDT